MCLRAYALVLMSADRCLAAFLAACKPITQLVAVTIAFVAGLIIIILLNSFAWSQYNTMKYEFAGHGRTVCISNDG